MKTLKLKTMDAEIRFFMTTKDEMEFFEFADKQIDGLVKKTQSEKQTLQIGDCALLYTPTVFENNVMYSGVLEIRIENSDRACHDQLRANTAYKKLRNWIKKKYWSRLAFINKKKKDQLTPSRIHWLAPDAKKWKEKNAEEHILKLSKTSWMIFEIGF